MLRRSRNSEFLDVSPLICKDLSLSTFINWIENSPGFSFARISDGGFFCMQGRKGKNCDGVIYSPDQAEALMRVMKDPSITHGITSIAINAAGAAEWLSTMNIVVDWYDADVMNKASDDGKLLPLIECLRKRSIVMVGPVHLHKFAGFKIQAFVKCHPTDAFEEVEELELEIAYRVKKAKADTVLLSAGQGASPTLVSRLHRLYPELTVIDVGSLWDPYVGVLSRSGHKKRGWEGYKKLGRVNFGQRVEEW